MVATIRSGSSEKLSNTFGFCPDMRSMKLGRSTGRTRKSKPQAREGDASGGTADRRSGNRRTVFTLLSGRSVDAFGPEFGYQDTELLHDFTGETQRGELLELRDLSAQYWRVGPDI